jgi:excisionase family DNA binding protein
VNTERLVTLAEVADTLRVSPHTIRSWIRKGRLQPVRICRRLLFRSADVERFIAASVTHLSVERRTESTDIQQFAATAGGNREAS